MEHSLSRGPKATPGAAPTPRDARSTQSAQDSVQQPGLFDPGRHDPGKRFVGVKMK